MNVLVPSVAAGILFVLSLVPAGESESAGSAREAFEFTFPKTLSQTGFFADVGKHTVKTGFHTYEVNVEAWADGASKLRFLRLPEGKSATFAKSGAWEFPAGTVFMQTMEIAAGAKTKRRIETRVIVVGEKGLLFGTYAWREDQSDADFVEKGRSVGISWDDGYLLWNVAKVSDCDECHNAKTQSLLGMTTAQLNRVDDGVHQFARFSKLGIVKGLPKDVKGLSRLPDPNDPRVPLAKRARSYLDTNCSSCHRPGGNGSGFMDLRYETPVEKTGLGHEREILIEGRPRSSWIFLRIIYEGRRKMPNVLTIHTDEKGAELIHDWVESLEHP